MRDPTDLDIFGSWISDASLPALFQRAAPTPHIVLDHFLKPDIAEAVHEAFPPYSPDSWCEYNNPIEVKYANNNISAMPVECRQVFSALSSDRMLDFMRRLTGISDLNHDEYLHGAGLHMHPRNGRLMMHLDYEKHPFTGQQRRVNIILYLSKGWDPAWNGATELWDADMTQCEVSCNVVFNRAIIFNTTELSWHGVPEIIRCPPGCQRKTLAFYYVSPMRNEADSKKVGCNEEGFRTKACFVQRPTDERDAGLEALLAIRPHRRITPEDLQRHCPDWTPES